MLCIKTRLEKDRSCIETQHVCIVDTWNTHPQNI